MIPILKNLLLFKFLTLQYIEGNVRIVCDQFYVIPVVKDPFIIRFLPTPIFCNARTCLAGEGFTKQLFDENPRKQCHVWVPED